MSKAITVQKEVAKPVLNQLGGPHRDDERTWLSFTMQHNGNAFALTAYYKDGGLQSVHMLRAGDTSKYLFVLEKKVGRIWIGSKTDDRIDFKLPLHIAEFRGFGIDEKALWLELEKKGLKTVKRA